MGKVGDRGNSVEPWKSDSYDENNERKTYSEYSSYRDASLANFDRVFFFTKSRLISLIAIEPCHQRQGCPNRRYGHNKQNRLATSEICRDDTACMSIP